MIKGLYIGRFQPFHYGHLKAVEYCLSRVDFLIIGIGSSQFKDTVKNPFSIEERFVMVVLALKEADVDFGRLCITAIPDSRPGEKWSEIVRSRCPSFEVVFTNDPWTRREIADLNVKIEPIPFYRREIYEATKIRMKILNDEEWESLIPASVVRFLNEINAVERLKAIYLPTPQT
ncbi:MAG: nicotinamide-nucleotide adenylyltransferase [Thermoproteota archaeon]|nr:MAG: nicotinamide-nucleotide adenylyltransferase [Candidatus Korarchaeota archaeon]